MKSCNDKMYTCTMSCCNFVVHVKSCNDQMYKWTDNGQFHDKFHTCSFCRLSFLKCYCCLFPNGNFTISLQMWSANVLWCWIVDRFNIFTFLNDNNMYVLWNINKSLTFQQFDIIPRLQITIEEKWWNSHLETSNNNISKNLTFKMTRCESCREIDHFCMRD